MNLELPTTEGLAKLAPHKKPENLVRPLRQIKDQITQHRLAIGKDPQMERSNGNRYLSHTIFKENPYQRLSAAKMPLLSSTASLPSVNPSVPFVPAGQSTQMIIGATGENDLQLLSTTQKLYQMYDLKRVFFSAYVPLNEDAALPALGTAPPLLREHRL